MGDFCGGLGSRTAGVLLAVAAAQIVGFLGVLAVVLATAQPVPGLDVLVWAGLAGLAGAVGLACFYRALSTDAMSLAAPVAASIGAGVPAVVGLATGDKVGVSQIVGIVLALAAVSIVSLPTGPVAGRPKALPVTIAAGLGFAGFFLLVDQASGIGEPSPWWVLLGVRMTAVVAIVPLLVRARGDLPSVGRRTGLVLLLAGIGDLGGNLFFLLARIEGVLSVAVVLSSLYPVITGLLAVGVLKERLQRQQVVGIVLAVAAIVLIAI